MFTAKNSRSHVDNLSAWCKAITLPDIGLMLLQRPEKLCLSSGAVASLPTRKHSIDWLLLNPTLKSLDHPASFEIESNKTFFFKVFCSLIHSNIRRITIRFDLKCITPKTENTLTTELPFTANNFFGIA